MFELPEFDIEQVIEDAAKKGLITLAAFDGQGVRPFAQWTNTREFWSGRFDGGYQRVRILVPGRRELARLEAADKAVPQPATPSAAQCALPERLHVDDIDSFAKVRDVTLADVDAYTHRGYLDIAEERVQLAIEAILSESLHKKDWGGEENDLYSSNVVYRSQRRSTAFLLRATALKRR